MQALTKSMVDNFNNGGKEKDNEQKIKIFITRKYIAGRVASN